MKFDPITHTTALNPLPTFRINSWGWRIVCPEQPARDYRELLRHRLARLRGNRPIILMVHGGGFSPFADGADAQATVYARHMASTRWEHRAWPARFAPRNIETGECLALPYGWHATDSAILSKPNNCALFEKAGREGRNLAEVINAIRPICGDRKIHILCHGLGARVVMQCFEDLCSAIVERVVILGGHEFNANTLTALGTPAARKAWFYNIRSDCQVMVDLRADAEMPKSGPKDQLIANGFVFQRRNWVDLNMSVRDQRLAFLRGAPARTSPNAQCSWSFGPERWVDEFVTRILYSAPDTEIATLKERLKQIRPNAKLRDAGFLHRHFAVLSPLRARKAR